MKPFRIHIGHTKNGRDRWRYFGTVQAAIAAANAIFVKYGVVVSVTANPEKTSK